MRIRGYFDTYPDFRFPAALRSRSHATSALTIQFIGSGMLPGFRAIYGFGSPFFSHCPPTAARLNDLAGRGGCVAICATSVALRDSYESRNLC